MIYSDSQKYVVIAFTVVSALAKGNYFADRNNLFTLIRRFAMLNRFSHFTTFKSHLAYLFRNQTHHEDDNGGHEEQCTHVSEPVIQDEGIEIITQAG